MDRLVWKLQQGPTAEASQTITGIFCRAMEDSLRIGLLGIGL
jgi:hypothetical protein